MKETTAWEEFKKLDLDWKANEEIFIHTTTCLKNIDPFYLAGKDQYYFINEAHDKILSGDRSWDKAEYTNFLYFFKSVIKSIIWNYKVSTERHPEKADEGSAYLVNYPGIYDEEKDTVKKGKKIRNYPDPYLKNLKDAVRFEKSEGIYGSLLQKILKENRALQKKSNMLIRARETKGIFTSKKQMEIAKEIRVVQRKQKALQKEIKSIFFPITQKQRKLRKVYFSYLESVKKRGSGPR